MNKRRIYFILIAIFVVLFALCGTLFWIGRTNNDSENLHEYSSEPKQVEKNNTPISDNALNNVSDDAKTETPEINKDAEQQQIATQHSVVNIIEKTVSPTAETDKQKSETNQETYQLPKFLPLDPDGAVPQTIAEIEEYINDMANVIRDLFKDNDKLRELVDGISRQQDEKKQEKSLRDTFIDKALGKDTGKLSETDAQRFIRDFTKQSRLRDRAGLMRERERVTSEFQELLAETQAAEQEANFMKRSFQKTEAAAERINKQMNPP